jgi:hypothetical protein
MIYKSRHQFALLEVAMVRPSPARIFCLFVLFAFPAVVAAQQPTSADQSIALKDAESGKDYSYTPKMQGGTPPFQWSLSGKLPTNVNWSSTDGSIYGSLQGAAPGIYTFELTLTDSSDPQMKASQQFTLTVKPAPLKIVAVPGQLKILPGVVSASAPAGAAAQTPTTNSAKTSSDDGSHDGTDASKKGEGGNKSVAAKSTSPLKLDPDTVPAGTGDVKITVSGPTDSSTQFFVSCSTTAISTDSKDKPHSAWNDRAKNFTIVFDASAVKEAQTILISTSGGCSKTDSTSLAVLNVSGFNDMAPLGEAMVGVTVSAASSANPQAVFLGLGLMDIPVSLTAASRNISQSKLGSFWVSGQLGLKGMAQPGAVSGALSSGYFATAVNATPDKIVQSVDMSLHIGVELHQWRIPIATFDVPNSQNAATHESKPRTIAMLSLIGGGGAITPLSLSQANPQVFVATQQIITTYNGMTNGDGKTTIAFPTNCPATPCYVTFTPADRSHFYRYYDGGLRLKLYSRDYPDGELRFPAILDLTVGQNEYVTGGIAHGPVLHVGGSFPIPRADSFYGFGSMDLGLTRGSGGGAQLFFLPVPTSVQPPPTATSANVTNIITGQPNRDRYVFGFGVDLIHLLTPKKSAAPPTC